MTEHILAKATWKGATLAQSDHAVVVEGNRYFPPEDVNMEFFEPSDTHSTCPWKGVASYLTVVVDGQRNTDAAWFYPEPSDAARQITGHLAFWKGVDVQA